MLWFCLGSEINYMEMYGLWTPDHPITVSWLNSAFQICSSFSVKISITLLGRLFMVFIQPQDFY